MTRVDFYHLEKWSLDKALPQLLEKVLSAGMRAVVKTSSAEMVEHLNSVLWTYRDNSWLPHGSQADGNAAQQPIWLTTDDENPNEAAVLVLTDGVACSNISSYDRCLDMFNGHNIDDVAEARERWKTAREAGHELHYWQQNERGAWKEKATG